VNLSNVKEINQKLQAEIRESKQERDQLHKTIQQIIADNEKLH
jgi:hypothetical protein